MLKIHFGFCGNKSCILRVRSCGFVCPERTTALLGKYCISAHFIHHKPFFLRLKIILQYVPPSLFFTTKHLVLQPADNQSFQKPICLRPKINMIFDKDIRNLWRKCMQSFAKINAFVLWDAEKNFTRKTQMGCFGLMSF